MNSSDVVPRPFPPVKNNLLVSTKRKAFSVSPQHSEDDDWRRSQRFQSPNRRTKKLVSMVPASDSSFCLVEGKDQETRGNSLPRPSSAPEPCLRSWPVPRSQSSDRNIIKKSKAYEERIRNLSGNSTTSEGALLKPAFVRHNLIRSLDSDTGGFRSPVWSKSSLSSLDSSTENLDTSKGSSTEQSRSRPTSRRSQSILQKAKIWETVDERPENCFSYVPWSKNIAKSKKHQENPVMKTCSSPSILEMMMAEDQQKGEVKMRQKVILEKKSSLDGDLNKRTSLPPLFEENIEIIDKEVLCRRKRDECQYEVRDNNDMGIEEKVPSVEQKIRMFESLDSLNNSSETIPQKTKSPLIYVIPTQTCLQKRKSKEPVSERELLEKHSISDPFALLESTLTKIDQVFVQSPKVVHLCEYQNTLETESKEEEEMREASEARAVTGENNVKEVSEEENCSCDFSEPTECEESSGLGQYNSQGVDNESFQKGRRESSGQPADNDATCAVDDNEEETVKLKSNATRIVRPLVSSPSEEEELERDVKAARALKNREKIEVFEIEDKDDVQENNSFERDFSVGVVSAESGNRLDIPTFVRIQEEESLDLQPENEPSVKCDIVIKVTPCDDENEEEHDVDVEESLEGEESSSSTLGEEGDHAIIDDVIISTDNNSDAEDLMNDFLHDKADGRLSVPSSENSDENKVFNSPFGTSFIKDEDLELVQVSDDSYSEESDEYEALREQRLQSQRSVSPERDVSPEDAEQAEWQTQLRHWSSASQSPTRVIPGLNEEDLSILEPDFHSHIADVVVSHSVLEDIFEVVYGDRETDGDSDGESDINEEFISSLRPNRRFEEREAAPEREVEEEDRENAELQTTLRRSRGNDPYLGRNIKRDSLKNRLSCNLEILDESTIQEEGKSRHSIEKSDQLMQENDDVCAGHSPFRLYRSLSAGSDLDNLKLIAQQTENFHTLLSNRLKLGDPVDSPSTRSPSFSRRINSDSPITASIQSINKLAEGVEDLKEKLSSHVGIFFPMTARDEKLENLVTDNEFAELKKPVNKKLSRSHSWQGFGTKEMKRYIRQQAFWESKRYEQVNAADLNLPPPPQTPPALKNKQVSSPLLNRRKGRTLAGSSSRRYRPLAGQSPNRSGTKPKTFESQVFENHEEIANALESDSDSSSDEIEKMKQNSSVSDRGDVKWDGKKFDEKAEQISNDIESKGDLSRDQIQHLMSVLMNIRQSHEEESDGGGPRHVSPEPTEEELGQLLTLMGQELDGTRVKNTNVTQKHPSLASQFLYRQKYLSIIQEEEESSEAMSTPETSRPNSRPLLGQISLNSGKREEQEKESTLENSEERSDSPLTNVPDVLESASFSFKDRSDDIRKRASLNLSEILDTLPPPTEPYPNEFECENEETKVTKMRITSSNLNPQHVFLSERPVMSSMSSDMTFERVSLDKKIKSHSESPSFYRPFSSDEGSLSSDPKMNFDDDTMPDLVMDTRPKNRPQDKALKSPSPFSMMKEKLKNVINSHRTQSYYINEPSEAFDVETKEAPRKEDSKVQRFLRSLSWKESSGDAELVSSARRGSLTEEQLKPNGSKEDVEMYAKSRPSKKRLPKLKKTHSLDK